MEISAVTRRQWLLQTGGAVAAGTTGQIARSLTLRAFDPDGQPAPVDRLRTLLLIDPHGQPYRLQPKAQADGTAVLELPRGRFEISMVLPVRDFGRVYLYADNGGALYAPSAAGELLLNYEFARSRAAFVRRYVKAAQAEGVVFGAATMERLSRGEAALARASQASGITERAGHSNDALADTMWAGEMAAVERARHRIARTGPRPGFLFGCNAFRYARSEEYARLFRAVFNFATLPFYRASTEKVEGSPDWSAVDAILEKMAGADILTKGHPLVWFHRAGIPEFLKTKPWAEIKQSCRDYILRSVGRYRTRIHAWDVINEAHDWANELRFDQQQLLELTRLAADATQEADPTAFRVVNACCTWGEYVAQGRSYFGVLPHPAQTPFEYYRTLSAARVSYEAVGLQLYNPARDMLEIERQLERFFALEKPVHITELGVPSTSANAKDPRTETLWHGSAWTPEVQADWIEQFYTICYSKPQIQAITWWDLSDPAFIRDGGLLDGKLQPKESYGRLRRLIASWRA